jgi:hypothetical protein
MTSESVAFALIAVTVGSHIMSLEPAMKLVAGIDDPIRTVRQNQDLMCDGLGWRPLLADWDYSATDARLRREIFPTATWCDPVTTAG